MKNLYLKNLKLLNRNNVLIEEHDACGVGFVASMNGKARRDVVINGINALKAVWHRGAVDADGKLEMVHVYILSLAKSSLKINKFYWSFIKRKSETLYRNDILTEK